MVMESAVGGHGNQWRDRRMDGDRVAMTSAPSRRTSWADFVRGGSLETGRELADEEPPTVRPSRLAGPRAVANDLFEHVDGHP
jgi:hypothetical protein